MKKMKMIKICRCIITCLLFSKTFLYAQENSNWFIGVKQSGSIIDTTSYSFFLGNNIDAENRIRLSISPKILIGNTNTTTVYNLGGNIELGYIHVLPFNYINLELGVGLQCGFSIAFNDPNTMYSYNIGIPILIGVERKITEYFSLGIESGYIAKLDGSIMNVENNLNIDLRDINTSLLFSFKLL